MMLLVVCLIAGIYLFSGFGRLEDRRFLYGSLLMLFYLVLYYFFPVIPSGASIYIGRLTQYLPIFSYGVILFGHAIPPSHKETYVHWAGFLGLVFSILSNFAM
ncbi:hypothetical protein KAT72_01805 [Aeromonas popoffii]|uniref:Uncharacterized protein n=1 Tax=Aeromonas popoffii TaxID=70856 RepID=A0ABS5GN59_9GAMM|nr:hypothetical protein [Aeromonas popoffii]MBR7627799.1 hypothetical protein [Aeromonas popoffii]